MRVAVVGAGVMGCTSALALSERGAEVIVLERAVPGAEASSAAAGILGAQIELHGRQEDATLFARARAGWQSWARFLHDTTGIDVGYRVSGVLLVTRASTELATLRRTVDWQRSQGFRAALLDAGAARAIEPELGPEVVSAAHFPDEAQLDPPSLLRALMVALTRGARITMRSGATVHGLIVERDRCVGVRLDDADLRADATVLAAGSWSSLVPGIPVGLPIVRPVRGQIVLLEERPPRLRSIVFGDNGYVVPRGDGRVLCGSTTEHVGFRKEVTAGGVHAILDNALSCIPSLGTAQVTGTWSNFRPYVDGEIALVGESTLPGLLLATGHYRNGILLSKETGDAIANAILGPKNDEVDS